MRIRFKKWARAELEACEFYVKNPEENKGNWESVFENKNNPLHLELGCGKGSFIAKKACENLDVNYIAVDLVDAMLGLAKRNIESNYKENNKETKNIKILRYDIERILNIFDKEDKVERIYINFCNPWPRGKHHKKRLTHTRQLEKYKDFLTDDAKIYFKTDDDNLFNDSINYFNNTEFKLERITYDLSSEEDFWNGERNIETEHEKMFKEKGIKIKALIARI